MAAPHEMQFSACTYLINIAYLSYISLYHKFRQRRSEVFARAVYRAPPQSCTTNAFASACRNACSRRALAAPIHAVNDSSGALARSAMQRTRRISSWQLVAVTPGSRLRMSAVFGFQKEGLWALEIQRLIGILVRKCRTQNLSRLAKTAPNETHPAASWPPSHRPTPSPPPTRPRRTRARARAGRP